MYGLLISFHVMVSLLMVGAIMLQAGKGAEIGASFGGSSQTIFGSRGPGTFLSKMTGILAVLFFLTSLGLSIMSKGRFVSSSALDLNKPAPAATAPAPGASPESAPAGQAAPALPPVSEPSAP